MIFKGGILMKRYTWSLQGPRRGCQHTKDMWQQGSHSLQAAGVSIFSLPDSEHKSRRVLRWPARWGTLVVRDGVQTWGGRWGPCSTGVRETGKGSSSVDRPGREDGEGCREVDANLQRDSLQILEAQKEGLGEGNSLNSFYKILSQDQNWAPCGR